MVLKDDKKSLKNKNFIKKNLLLIYFLFFIIINILDFLNIISGDLDFFKKLLSWSLIGYIFYKASLSKIFIGTRKKLYDLAYIFSFCLIAIPKSLLSYVKSNSTQEILSNDFNIFYSFLNQFLQILNNDPSMFLLTTFCIGVLFIIIISIGLLLNNEPKKPSFISSFNIKEGYFKYSIELSLLIFISLLFTIVIFNFFMEWFALAVDSILLVLGLIYYTISVIQNHIIKTPVKFLNNVSNFGNNFFKKIIELFQDKKTMFIGIAFILTLHTLVDAGVFLIPYALGTKNLLYFSSLDSFGTSHIPIFNFRADGFTNSQFYEDLIKITPNSLINLTDKIFLVFGILLNYVSALFLFFSLMILPFYVFYKNTHKRKIKFNKIFSILFITSLLLYFITNLVIYTPHTTSQNNQNLNLVPIGFKTIESDLTNKFGINGVDIYTNNIISNLKEEKSMFDINSTILIFFTILIFILIKYDKYETYHNKFILLTVLIFFLYYIFLFSHSSINIELNNINEINQNDITKTKFNEEKTFYQIEKNYSTSNYKYLNRNKISHNNQTNINFGLFTIPYKNNSHLDYLIIEIENHNENKTKTQMTIENPKNIILNEENFNIYSQKVNKSELHIIYLKTKKENIYYFLGENVINTTQNKLEVLSKVILTGDKTNYLSIKYENERILTIDSNNKNLNLEREINNLNFKDKIIDELKKMVQKLRLMFISIFYIFAIIAFTIYYINKNLNPIKN